MAESSTILSQAYGYGYILGLGAAFALMMIGITYILSRYLGQEQNSEGFTTASRSVGTGLVSSAVVSSWVWPATLLTSGLWGYTYGVSGGFFYALIGGLQITIFTQLAIQIKKHAPGCHTVAEIIRVRYDKYTHWVYLFYVTATNIMVSGCLLLGASQGFNASTGINIIAANFLLPLGVCVYTAFGGLKATFISDWIHTVIIFIAICVLCFKVLTSPIIGGLDNLYDMIMEASEKFPPTADGNYLKFRNKEIFETAYAIFVGGLSGVIGDPSYAQKAIAAKSVLKGYIFGGMAWAVVPWALGTAGGLVCRALLVYPGFRTYPDALSSAEANAGLPVIYAFGTLLGKSGAAVAVLNLFMSATSAMSAELIAFSSIATYDVYRGYINPNASGKKLVAMSHICTIGFSLFISCVSVIFNYVGVTVGWLITFYGIILAPGVAILTLSLFWKKTSSFGCTYGAPLATLCGIACWIGSAQAESGFVNKTSLMGSQALLIGNYVSMGSAFIFISILSLVKRDPNFDFSTLNDSFIAADDAKEDQIELMHTSNNKEKLNRDSKIALILNAIALFGGFIIVPIAFYGSDYTFSRIYFKQWYIIILICLVTAATYITFYPLWEGRNEIKKVCRVILTVGHLKPEDQVIEASSDDSIVNVKVESEKSKV